MIHKWILAVDTLLLKYKWWCVENIWIKVFIRLFSINKFNDRLNHPKIWLGNRYSHKKNTSSIKLYNFQFVQYSKKEVKRKYYKMNFRNNKKSRKIYRENVSNHNRIFHFKLFNLLKQLLVYIVKMKTGKYFFPGPKFLTSPPQ